MYKLIKTFFLILLCNNMFAQSNDILNVNLFEYSFSKYDTLKLKIDNNKKDTIYVVVSFQYYDKYKWEEAIFDIFNPESIEAKVIILSPYEQKVFSCSFLSIEPFVVKSKKYRLKVYHSPKLDSEIYNYTYSDHFRYCSSTPTAASL